MRSCVFWFQWSSREKPPYVTLSTESGRPPAWERASTRRGRSLPCVRLLPTKSTRSPAGAGPRLPDGESGVRGAAVVRPESAEQLDARASHAALQTIRAESARGLVKAVIGLDDTTPFATHVASVQLLEPGLESGLAGE